jgi:hypothetical protein
MARDQEHIEFDGFVVHQTELAVLFFVEQADEEIWFPLSQCELDYTETSILVPRWLARAKGL